MAFFLTFEGLDGSGKTTQLRLLKQRLESMGRKVVESVEPGGTAIGQQIRRILLDARNQNLAATAELLLYFASRAQAVDEIIRPALDEGAIVLSDRFTDATVAYQGFGRGLGLDTVLAVDRIACRGLNPDLTILLDIDLESGLERARSHKSADRLEVEQADFYERVRDAYHDIARREPERVRIVDARGEVEAVAARVWEAVRARV